MIEMKGIKDMHRHLLKWSAILMLSLLLGVNDSHGRTDRGHLEDAAILTAAMGEGTLLSGRNRVPQMDPPVHGGALSVLFGNDYFAGNDNRYTSGLGLLWTSPDLNAFSPNHFCGKIGNLLSFIPTVGTSDYRTYLQSSLGMEIYTAKDITVADPPPEDHPYAGILYWDNSMVSIGSRSSHQFSLRLGLVGPATGAEYIQTRFHEIIDSPAPRGWDTQLGNEPIVNLFYQYGRRLMRKDLSDDFAMDLTAGTGGGIGNYYVGGNMGLTARIGRNLPDTYGSMPIIGETAPIAGLSPAGNRMVCYLFVEPQFIGALRWLPTDGNTFSDSRSGERDRWFANLSMGFMVGYGKVALSFTYHNIVGTTCFNSALSGNEDSYGTVILTVFLG